MRPPSQPRAYCLAARSPRAARRFFEYRIGRAASAHEKAPRLGRPRQSWVDTVNGVFHRHADGAAETAKRQPTVRLAPGLLGRLRRWERVDAEKSPPQVFVVEFGGGAGQERQDGVGDSVQARQGRRGRYGVRASPHLRVMARSQGVANTQDRRLPRNVGVNDHQALRPSRPRLSERGRAGDRSEMRTNWGRFCGPKSGLKFRHRRNCPQEIENIGGPGGNRTPNQTVMSGRL
jgi:hypothetical protein